MAATVVYVETIRCYLSSFMSRDQEISTLPVSLQQTTLRDNIVCLFMIFLFEY